MIYREQKFRSYDGESRKMKKVVKLDWDRDVLVREIDSDEETEEITPMNGTNLMQWTGLKDKNGREIFEGDILRFIFKTSKKYKEGTEHFHEVIWYPNKSKWSLKRIDEKGNLHIIGISKVKVNETHEVVGNVYQTPKPLVTGNKEKTK